jgi:hypothetical protein
MLREEQKICRNLSLGLATKARACEGVGQVGTLGITFHVFMSVGECEGMNPMSVGKCEGMNPHTPK